MRHRTIANVLTNAELSNIIFLKSDKNFTVIYYLDNRKVILNYILKVIEGYLTPLTIFKRVHRSYIINLNHLVEIDKQAGFLKLINNIAIPISSDYGLPSETEMIQNRTNGVGQFKTLTNMNFTIIVDEKKIANKVLIGKAGFIRFKTTFSVLQNFDKRTRWLTGVDADETGHYKHLFLLKANKNAETLGKKMICNNNMWSFDIRHVIKEMKLKIPQSCEIEVFEDGEMEGFKITLGGREHKI